MFGKKKQNTYSKQFNLKTKHEHEEQEEYANQKTDVNQSCYEIHDDKEEESALEKDIKIDGTEKLDEINIVDNMDSTYIINGIDEIDRVNEMDKDEKQKVNYLKEIRDMIIYFVVVIAIVSFIYTYIGQQVEVSGMSMESTLNDKDHLILEKLTYRFEGPKRYDVVVFRPYSSNKDLYYIKRIIGLPGETVQIVGSNIYIDGKMLIEDYGKEAILDGGYAKELITLGNDEYFVLGDNRNNSKDSRFSDVGNIQREAIVGRTWIRIWPLDSAGFLKHQ